MIKGIGIDIIEIDRIKSAVEKFKGSFLNKVYTPHEITYCTVKKAYRFPELAVRFAAKEAYTKALGTGLGKVFWKDIEIKNDRLGKPQVYIKGKLDKKVHVSLSHSRESAVAVVVLE